MKTAKTVVGLEMAGFVVVVVVLWLDELLDGPHWLFGAPRTPVNWVESLFETGLVLVLGVFTMAASWRFLRRIRRLEGLLPICAACKKIRSDDVWVPVEEYVRDHSEAEFTHGLCPKCLEQYYGEGGRRP